MFLQPSRPVSIPSGLPGFGRLRSLFAVLGAIVAVTVLGACSSPDPFVYDSLAYNREDPEFGKPRKKRDTVTVCYSKYGSAQREVAILAANACAEFGAGIKFIGNSYVNCPLMTPVGAQFSCVGAAARIPARGPVPSYSMDRRAPVAGTAGQPGTPLNGFHDGDRPMGVLFGRPVTSGSDTPAPTPAPTPVPGDEQGR